MTEDEEYLLREALSILGQFDGLPNLDALENLRLSVGGGRKERRRIISFTRNPLQNSNLLGELLLLFPSVKLFNLITIFFQIQRRYTLSMFIPIY